MASLYDFVGNCFLIGDFLIEEQSGYHGHIGDRKNQCAQNCQGYSLCHRSEHPSFNSDQSENWDVNHEDDNFPKSCGTPNFLTCQKDLFIHLFLADYLSAQAYLESMDNGFYDNYRSIYNQTEIYCPQAHEIRRNPQKVHHGDSKQHG